jgi:Ca2+-binding RTX toxin-like protein
MAYRQPLSGSWPTWYADADIEALVQLWGAEVQLFTNGADVIQGRDYSEFFSAAQGDDIIHGGGGNDQIRGGRGNDWINGNTGNDTLYGDLGDDTVRGGKGDDSVFGGGGNDLVTGDLGNDRLDGGDGDDELWGGAGADVFVLSAGADRIKDFDWQAGDRLQVAASVGYRLAAGSGGLLVQTALGATVLEGVALGSFNTAAITLV